MTAERIRDKIAAEKRRGKYLGGVPPLGYKVDRDRRRLVVVPAEAELVRSVFRRFLESGSAVAVARELNGEGHTTKSWTTKKGQVRPGRAWNKAHLYRVLTNPTYIGLIKHKDKTYPGLHEPIVAPPLWEQVQTALAGHAPPGAGASRSRTPALLKGLIRCGHCGSSMGVTFARKKGRTYRYYLCLMANKQGYAACPVKTVSAGTVESAVTMQLRKMLRSPDELSGILHSLEARRAAERRQLTTRRRRLVRDIQAAQAEASSLLHGELDRGNGFVREELARLDRKRVELEGQLRSVAWELDSSTRVEIPTDAMTAELARLDGLWDELFPAEQERVVRLLVEEVVVHVDRLEVAVRPAGLRAIVGELTGKENEHATDSNAG